jgi:hypothetical protein
MDDAMDDEPFLIKGSSLRTKLDYASQRFGEQASASLDSYLVETLGDRPVLDADWYPFAVYDGLLRLLVRRCLGGDMTRLQEVGHYSAESALGSVYESYARGGRFGAFVDRLPMLHQRLYTVSRLVVQAKEDAACVLETVDMPCISEADTNVSCGFFVGAARLLGHPEALGTIQPAETTVRYRISWG